MLSKKKKGLHKSFSGDLLKKKVFTKNFQAISTKKRFPKNFSSAPQNSNNSKNSAVLEPRTGQFSRTPPLVGTKEIELLDMCTCNWYWARWFLRWKMEQTDFVVESFSARSPRIDCQNKLEPHRQHTYTFCKKLMGNLRYRRCKLKVWELGCFLELHHF